MTLEDAKAEVRSILDMAVSLGGNADNVYDGLRKAERECRQTTSYTEAHAEKYCMMRLALCDITNNAKYRY